MKRINVIIIFLLNIQLSEAQCTFITSFMTDQFGGPSKTIRADNKLFFSAYDTINGRELWCTDGTVTGTYIVKDINPGVSNGINHDYFELTSYNLNGIVYFRADDGLTGLELWRSDGTDTGTYLVKDLTPGASGSSPGYFTSIDSILYFTNSTGTQLCRSDGTDAGTWSFYSFNIVSQLTAFKGKLYFAADNVNGGQELWKSDGTSGGTHLLKDLNGVLGASLPCNFHATGNTLYFMAATNDGWELWKTKGSQASTVMVKDINPGGANGVLSFYTDVFTAVIDTIIYFKADDGVNGAQLWKSDGTDSGTMRLSNLASGVDTYCTFPVVNGKVLFYGYGLQHWWQYDPVADSCSETGYPFFFYFLYSSGNKYTFIDSNFLFAGKDTVYGCEMWQSDGTPAGTTRIQETHLTDNWFAALTQGFNSILGVIGNKLLFTLARTPYDTKIPLYIYDPANLSACYPPSVIVPVPVADTAVHFVWNRIPGATDYELQYRKAGTGAWTTANTSLSYKALNNLDTATDYEYQLRANCNGSWTNWSDLQTYNTAFSQNDNYVNILAERSESSTTERIYWLKSAQIPFIQIRYRPYGTTAWTQTSNSTGYKRITGLQPNTFYEYQYKASWDVWQSFNYRYFVTEDVNTSVTDYTYKQQGIDVYPNPAKGKIKIKHELEGDITFEISDNIGRIIRSGKLSGNQVDISNMSPGLYFLSFKTGYFGEVKKIVIE